MEDQSVTTEQTVPSRDMVIKEITDTVRFIMRRNSEGMGAIGLEELLDKKLEQNIIQNFEGQISVPEYEQIVTRMFQEEGKETEADDSGGILREIEAEAEQGDFERLRREIEAETEMLLRKQHVRDVEDVKMRVFRKLRIKTENEELARKAILDRYMNTAREIIFDVISDWMDKGVTDDTKLLRAIKLQRFAIEPKKFTEFLAAGKRQYRSRKEGGDRPAAGKMDQAVASDGSGETDDEARQQRERIARDKMHKKKERFIEKFVKPIRFQLIENRDAGGGIRHLGYRGIIMGKDMQVKAISRQNKVEELKIVFNRLMRGQKRIFELDINDLKFLREGPQGMRGFVRKLQDVLDFWGQPSLQELLWFIMFGLTEKNGIHTSVVRFIRDNIFKYFSELDDTLNQYALNKMMGA